MNPITQHVEVSHFVLRELFLPIWKAPNKPRFVPIRPAKHNEGTSALQPSLLTLATTFGGQKLSNEPNDQIVLGRILINFVLSKLSFKFSQKISVF
jgi:hypothetical protein